MWGLKNMCYQQYFCRWNQVDLRHPTCRAQQVRTSWKQIQDIHVNFWCFVSSRKFILALCKKMNKFATSNNFVAETHILMSKANSKKSQKAVTDGKISLLKISQHSIHQQNDKESTWTSSTIITQSRDARRTTSAQEIELTQSDRGQWHWIFLQVHQSCGKKILVMHHIHAPRL